MTEQHPITPPPELVQQWVSLACEYEGNETWIDLATQAARWGADQELEACCGLLDEWGLDGDDLMECRRPKPPSLKEQALQAAQRFYAKGHGDCTDEEIKDDFDTIRRALEQLDD